MKTKLLSLILLVSLLACKRPSETINQNNSIGIFNNVSGYSPSQVTLSFSNPQPNETFSITYLDSLKNLHTVAMGYSDYYKSGFLPLVSTSQNTYSFELFSVASFGKNAPSKTHFFTLNIYNNQKLLAAHSFHLGISHHPTTAYNLDSATIDGRPVVLDTATFDQVHPDYIKDHKNIALAISGGLVCLKY